MSIGEEMKEEVCLVNKSQVCKNLKWATIHFSIVSWGEVSSNQTKILSLVSFQ